MRQSNTKRRLFCCGYYMSIIIIINQTHLLTHPRSKEDFTQKTFMTSDTLNELYLALPTTGGICWTRMELENKLDRSFALWLDLQKAWGNISVEVLRKYTDTREMCCCNYCKRRTYRILQFKVDKNSMTHYI